jgi:hypothetical protein
MTFKEIPEPVKQRAAALMHKKHIALAQALCEALSEAFNRQFICTGGTPAQPVADYRPLKEN